MGPCAGLASHSGEVVMLLVASVYEKREFWAGLLGCLWCATLPTYHWLVCALKKTKEGASFCYCAYVLHISGYSGFLRNLPTNTTMFLRGLWLCGGGGSWQGLSESGKNWGVATHLSEIIELNLERNCHTFFVFNAILELWLLNYLWKMRDYPHFSFWIPVTLAGICFFPIVITFAKMHLY